MLIYPPADHRLHTHAHKPLSPGSRPIPHGRCRLPVVDPAVLHRGDDESRGTIEAGRYPRIEDCHCNLHQLRSSANLDKQ